MRSARLTALLTRWMLAAAVACGVAVAAAAAADPLDGLEAPIGEIRLHLPEFRLQPPADSPPPLDPALPLEVEPRRPFGRAGSNFFTLGGGAAYDLGDNTDYNGYLGFSRFVADEIEFAVELGGWYFDQVGKNTGGVSGLMYFRWHFLHDPEFTWSIFGEVGIGILAAVDEVPSGGQEVNFLPRAGAGITRQITDDGVRLYGGVRWHHMSNGRFSGDARNPSRDAPMIYLGVMVPF